MPKESPKQKAIVERVMHEFKHGELDQRGGQPVKNPKQAIAIALHEAGASNQESPQKNDANLRRTASRERQGKTAKAQKDGKAKPAQKDKGRSREELYAEAKRRNVAGRSKMTKPQLEHALHG